MRFSAITIAAVLILGCGRETVQGAPRVAAPSHGMSLSSSAFADGKSIPSRYACNGRSISPPLVIRNVPQKVKSLALIVTDPDAPGGTFTHWVVWNIPPRDAAIAEAGSPGGVTGENDFGKEGYGAPCPPDGVHRYVFDLYALDTTLALPAGSKREALEAAIARHIIAQSRLTGTYRK